MAWRLVGWRLLALALLTGGPASAQNEWVAEEPSPPCPSNSTDPLKRPRPDYDGRGPEPEGCEALIWIPRALLAPLYLVEEYALRQPVGAGATYAEQHPLPKWVTSLFRFGPNDEGGIFPTFFFDFNVRPSVGLHFFWNNFLATGNRISADAAYGGTQWVTLAVGDIYNFSPTESLSGQVRWNRRPDSLYYGIGSSTTNTYESRVGSDVILGIVTYKTLVAKRLELETTATIKRTVYQPYSCCGDPSMQQRVEAGQLPPPPGYLLNYTATSVNVRAVYDTRPPRPEPQSGFRATLALRPGLDVGQGIDGTWLRYGAQLEGFWDVTGKARVLSLGITALFADPLGSSLLPFTEYISLGGVEPFVGFNPGRLLDRSALVAQLGWHWPVFAYVDGVASVSFGNVFDAHLQNFSFSLLRLGAELGLRTTGTGSSTFELVFGVGTETFQNGLQLTGFRFAFGVVYGL
ncbi:MAG TPA: BamA/TamA family outer membrane protein [Myxococcaceae bacterium]|nr:BamA/TamA family outer membrane protein [Myxococcaceae bacterium]